MKALKKDLIAISIFSLCLISINLNPVVASTSKPVPNPYPSIQGKVLFTIYKPTNLLGYTLTSSTILNCDMGDINQEAKFYYKKGFLLLGITESAFGHCPTPNRVSKAFQTTINNMPASANVYCRFGTDPKIYNSCSLADFPKTGGNIVFFGKAKNSYTNSRLEVSSSGSLPYKQLLYIAKSFQ
jgi:hypothetical protein